MTNRPLAAAVRYLRTLTDLQSAATAADGQLLDRFARMRDEAAFAALLRRHGPMVYGTAIKPVKGERPNFQIFFGAGGAGHRRAGPRRNRPDPPPGVPLLVRVESTHLKFPGRGRL
jgi:hypothetical protein